MKKCPRVFFNAEGRTDGQAERYDEANTRFRNFADAIKQNNINPTFSPFSSAARDRTLVNIKH